MNRTFVVLNLNNILVSHDLKKMKHSKCCLRRIMAAGKKVKFEVIPSNARKEMN